MVGIIPTIDPASSINNLRFLAALGRSTLIFHRDQTFHSDSRGHSNGTSRYDAYSALVIRNFNLICSGREEEPFIMVIKPELSGRSA